MGPKAVILCVYCRFNVVSNINNNDVALSEMIRYTYGNRQCDRRTAYIGPIDQRIPAMG